MPNYSKIYHKEYLREILAEPAKFISNIKTEAYLLETNEFIFPVTINGKEYSNTYGGVTYCL
ncbi:MAG: hypothetical protein LW832_08935 [Parachlamydia sp.]|jgi:hypothetical protein|nr:hypothetical protein [Parachlamydia sp.]